MEDNSGHNNKGQKERSTDSNNYQDQLQSAEKELQRAEHEQQAQQERHRLARFHLSHCLREQTYVAERVADAQAQLEAVERDLEAASKCVLLLKRDRCMQ